MSGASHLDAIHPLPAIISAMSEKPDGSAPASPRQVIAAMEVHAPSRRNRRLAGLLAAANANDKLKARWHGQQVTAQRLGMSDHSWVHLQIVLNSALRIFRLLHSAGVPSAIETDYAMKAADAEVVIAGGCLLHDLGMSIHRVDHESFSLFLAADLLDDLLADVYDDPERTIVASEILHAIIGHRTGGRPLTLEAGVVRVADALDMEHGRSRVSLETHLPNIHSLSAAAIDEVRIVPGEQRTIRVEVEMNNSAGVFQVDDLLATKLRGSGLEDHIEVVARIDAEHEKRLLTVYRI
jgi:metal-dependent HD superfamily phosphatase/phosphodiesterase